MPRGVTHLERHFGICRERDDFPICERLYIREGDGAAAPRGEVPVRIGVVARAVFACIDGAGDAAQEVVDAADVVEVAVREQETLDRPALFLCMRGEAVALGPGINEKTVLRLIVNIKEGVRRDHVADGHALNHPYSPLSIHRHGAGRRSRGK